MQRKVILKVEDLEFENNNESVLDCYKSTMELLRNKGYFFDGMLISIQSKIAYVWKYVKPSRRKPLIA